MLYQELFGAFEKVRWDMGKDIPWDKFEPAKLSDEQARTIKMNAITEWSALPATEMFLRDNQDDSDFSAFMSIWFYEEQKHAVVLMEYLRRFRPDLLPTDEELHAVRFKFDPAPALETLMLHFCGEIRLTQWYRRAASWHTEPVIKRIYETLAGDEARHAGAYFKYMRRAIEKLGDEAKVAFAKIGILMASAARAGKPMHPTNLHVNKGMFPNDTVQSKLPDAGWLEHWLDQQIKFDKVCEIKVVQSILAKLGTLYNRAIADPADLKRFRKELLAKMGEPRLGSGAAA
ncbi:MAG: ferritin-like domain-containing protein [Pseudomonadota bacterium]|nr:ferritin-like domain-containing protein [Pseudomonadota bacterium]